MKLKILQIGEPILRQPARPLSKAEVRGAEVQQLIALMRDTMRDAPGVGLAAPQIGVSLQLAVVEDRAETLAALDPAALTEREREPVPFQVLINPKLTIVDPGSRVFFEGCLSAAGLVGCVPRAAAVRVECLNELAEPVTVEASGWHARILQHEIDHLHGRLCLDRMEIRTLMSADNYARYWSDRPVDEARQT